MINEISEISFIKKKVVINGKDPGIDEILLFAIIPFLKGKKKGEKKK